MQKIPQKAVQKLYKSAVFIFRRDMRLDDNTGLIHALAHSLKVYPCFIFDPRQIHASKNDYFSHSCVQFMSESLRDLDYSIKQITPSGLNCIYGAYPGIIEDLVKATDAELLVVNGDYTKFSKTRDKQIEEVCNELGIDFKSFEDITLVTKEQAMTGREVGDFHQKYTPFYNSVKHFEIPKPQQCEFENFSKEKINLPKKNIIDDFGEQFFEKSDSLELKGGRREALKILKKFKRMKEYPKIRNSNTKHKGASMLSPYNKFGCLSIREIYWTTKIKCKDKAEPFIKQLFWRDFFYFISEFYPEIWENSRPLKPRFQKLKWWTDKELFEAWKEGRTGCPIVDAAMRKMNKTGWMTNRNRLIVSNYLIKDLHINWTWGEKYFAQKLIDYDPAQNNGGWQWSAGCGVDTQPYFRIFNPRLQSIKFDYTCEFIKEWVPELEGVRNEDIHEWEKRWEDYEGEVDYPKPFVYHDEEKKRSIRMYLDGLGMEDEAEYKRWNAGYNRSRTERFQKKNGTYVEGGAGNGNGGNKNNRRRKKRRNR